jgi:hypothetical protein
MKKIKFNILAISALLGMSLTMGSCAKDYLDRLPQHQYTEETFYGADDIDQSVMLKLLEPLYNSAWAKYNERAIYPIGSMRANDGWSPYLNGEFGRFQVTGLSTEIGNAWGAFYSVVTQANAIIRSMEKNAKEGTNQDMLNQINGEARLMRGLAYFYLVRGWGDVIIYEDNYAAAENPQIPLYTEESVLKFVIRDFEQAEKLLPEKATTANHPSRFVAKAYLAKALLAQSGWNKSTRDQATLDRVVTLCDEVINCGQYSLLPNYEDLFKVENNACYADNNKETLLALRWADPLTGEYAERNVNINDIGWNEVVPEIGAWGGSLHASVDMMNMYNEEPEDQVRASATFFIPGKTYDYIHKDKGGYTYTKNWMQIKKGIVGDKADCNGHLVSQGSPFNTYMLRFADVFLTKAEALLGNNESTSNAEALTAFNATRLRAGLKAKTSFTLEDLIRERRVEFGMECVNWFDMVTWYRWKPQFMLNYFNNKQFRGFMTNDGDVILNDDGTIAYRCIPSGEGVWYTGTSWNDNGDIQTSLWSDAERYNDGKIVYRQYGPEGGFDNDTNPIVTTGGIAMTKANGYTYDLWKIARETPGFAAIKLTEENIFMPYPENDVLQNPYFNLPPQEYKFGE